MKSDHHFRDKSQPIFRSWKSKWSFLTLNNGCQTSFYGHNLRNQANKPQGFHLPLIRCPPYMLE